MFFLYRGFPKSIKLFGDSISSSMAELCAGFSKCSMLSLGGCPLFSKPFKTFSLATGPASPFSINKLKYMLKRIKMKVMRVYEWDFLIYVFLNQ